MKKSKHAVRLLTFPPAFIAGNRRYMNLRRAFMALCKTFSFLFLRDKETRHWLKFVICILFVI